MRFYKCDMCGKEINPQNSSFSLWDRVRQNEKENNTKNSNDSDRLLMGISFEVYNDTCADPFAKVNTFQTLFRQEVCYDCYKKIWKLFNKKK